MSSGIALSMVFTSNLIDLTERKMETYEAMVRIQSNNMVVRTRVQANSSQDALWLLEGQYGASNVVTLPSLVS